MKKPPAPIKNVTLFGQFSIMTTPGPISGRFVVFTDPEGDETIIAGCRTKIQAKKYCEMLNQRLTQTN